MGLVVILAPYILLNLKGNFKHSLGVTLAFTAIAGKDIYARIHKYTKLSDMEAYEFLGSGCGDTDYLRKSGISNVYTRGSCNNLDLVEVRKNIYLLKEAGEGE